MTKNKTDKQFKTESREKSDENQVIEALNKEIQDHKMKNEELELLYKRALADYQNLQKRQEEEKEKIISYSAERLLSELLDILEALENSQRHLKDEGINKIIDKLKTVFAKEGLSEINPVGEPFDPSLHEAIGESEGESNTIVSVHRKGYKLNGKVIRPAVVTVGNGLEKKQEKV